MIIVQQIESDLERQNGFIITVRLQKIYQYACYWFRFLQEHQALTDAHVIRNGQPLILFDKTANNLYKKKAIKLADINIPLYLYLLHMYMRSLATEQKISH